MKKFIHLLPAFVAVMFLFTACVEEPPLPVSPTLSQVDEAGTVVDGDSILAGTAFFVRVQATQGDDLLNRITVQENGVDLDFNRITLDGDTAGSNPSPLPTEAQTGFTWTVGITAPADKDVTNSYDIIISDEGGNSASITLDIRTFDNAVLLGTYTEYLLLNKGGPTGTGGLDLDTGTGTGSTDSIAEIRDMGIDLGAPSNDKNWIQKIAPITENGVEMRYP